MAQIQALNTLFSKTLQTTIAKHPITGQHKIMNQWISSGNQIQLHTMLAQFTNLNSIDEHTLSEAMTYPFACNEQNSHVHCEGLKVVNVNSCGDSKPVPCQSNPADTSEIDAFLRLMNKLHTEKINLGR
tara:strand:+ start:2214 stop:2600 length:387 start_codon:yes stop_codon:yes gene_type:complete